jgi:hypothetical protein
MKNIKIIQKLHNLGITDYHEVVYNPTYEELYKEEGKRLVTAGPSLKTVLN